MYFDPVFNNYQLVFKNTVQSYSTRFAPLLSEPLEQKAYYSTLEESFVFVDTKE